MRIRVKPGTHPAAYAFTRSRTIAPGQVLSTYAGDVNSSPEFGTYRRMARWTVEEIRDVAGEPLYFLAKL